MILRMTHIRRDNHNSGYAKVSGYSCSIYNCEKKTFLIPLEEGLLRSTQTIVRPSFGPSMITATVIAKIFNAKLRNSLESEFDPHFSFAESKIHLYTGEDNIDERLI